MQYVRSFSGSVSKTWNSINPATLSGAIDVVVVEQDDGTLACSPFHVRFGKISLFRPYDKKVEFKVNDVKQDYSMKLGEGGEAFFVFETAADIPEGMQTSPLVSPATSPMALSLRQKQSDESLQEPEFLDISGDAPRRRPVSTIIDPRAVPFLSEQVRTHSDLGNMTPLSSSPNNESRPGSRWSAVGTLEPSPRLERSTSVEPVAPLGAGAASRLTEEERPKPQNRASEPGQVPLSPIVMRSTSPSVLTAAEVLSRANALSRKLTETNIPNIVTDSGDLKLDMTGYKTSEEQALRAEVVARDVLAQELDGNYDIGALIGADEQGNLWIYSSEEAKEAASKREAALLVPKPINDDAMSDPGYHSDGSSTIAGMDASEATTLKSPLLGMQTPPHTPPSATNAGEATRNYAKTLRLTSDQLKALNLTPGINSMSFSVNKATCQANMFYWSSGVPVVISDIDGTITKSDALGHVLNMIGRDWTHIGVAKLYTDIAANGYNILYLTSRSVGQADTTRNYLNGVVQDGFRLPKGPVILSPDRTVAALRREVYLRKPEVFKMGCLRDIKSLFGRQKSPFYAGFGNRFTDALSYRSVDIPSNRIFTINSNAEVSLDLLTLSKYRSSYVSMQEILDHFFPPIGLLVASGGENFTDFNYWREAPLEIDDFSSSDDEDDGGSGHGSGNSEDLGSDGYDDDEDDDDDDDDGRDPMQDSFMSQNSVDDEGLADTFTDDDDDASRRHSVDDAGSVTLREGTSPGRQQRGRSPGSR